MCVLQLCSSEQLQQQIFLLNQQLVLLRDTNRGLTEQLEGAETHCCTVSADTHTHTHPGMNYRCPSLRRAPECTGWMDPTVDVRVEAGGSCRYIFQVKL